MQVLLRRLLRLPGCLPREPSLTVEHGESADRESAHAFDLWRDRRESESFVRKPIEPAHMLADRDVGAEQARVHGPGADVQPSSRHAKKATMRLVIRSSLVWRKPYGSCIEC